MPQYPKILQHLIFQPPPLGQLLRQVSGQPCHFFFKRLIILGCCTHIPPRRQDVTVLADFIDAGRLAESGNVRLFLCTIPAPVVIGVGDLLDIFVGQFPMGTIRHEAHVASINEEHSMTEITRKGSHTTGSRQWPTA